jgi:hypothetical protein
VATIDWFVAAKRPRAAVALERLPMRSDRVHLVSAGLPALARDLFTHSGLEIIARARHADYVHQELSRQGADGGNPSLVEWERLPESLKDSNRRFAQSVGSAVGELGGALRPLTAAPTGADLDLPADRLEELAQREHERWVRDLQRDGWRTTDGAKDPHGKRHPLLVPWESLSEHEREKDRDSVRGLPRMLSLVGYELVMPEQESRRQPVE